jgi:hypothetical protein
MADESVSQNFSENADLQAKRVSTKKFSHIALVRIQEFLPMECKAKE